ncbi:MAG TPA: sugar ABC transporter substrate-binding protein [Chloroflexota bacterium]|jgi:multiple sugar transport system substrate-binding protein|nr:sugar ABC transporter substrate-binding protein [Chloroflexota bacterium]
MSAGLSRRSLLRRGIVVAALAPVVAACAPAEPPTPIPAPKPTAAPPAPTAAPPAPTTAPTAAPTTAPAKPTAAPTTAPAPQPTAASTTAPAASTQPAASASGTLTISTYGTPSYQDLGKAMQALWEKARPNVALKMEYWAGDDQAYQDSLMARLVAANPPDIAYMGGLGNLNEFQTKGGLLDLRQFWNDLPQADRDDFYPAPMQIVKGTKNELWGMPVRVNTETLFHWKPAFDAAKLPYPADTWTYQDLVDMSQKLVQKDSGGKVTVWGFSNGFYGAGDMWHLTPAVWAHGGDWFNADYTKFTGDAPEVVQAVQLLHDIKWKHKAMPLASALPQQQQDPYTSFSAGTLAMWMQGDWAYANLRDKTKGSDRAKAWDVARLPSGPKGRSTPINIGPIYAFKATKVPNLGWDYIKFFTSTEALNTHAKMLGIIPSRKSSAPAAIDPSQPPENAKRVLDQLAESSRPMSQPPHNNEVMDAFGQAMQAAFVSNSATVEQALKNAKAAIEKILAG